MPDVRPMCVHYRHGARLTKRADETEPRLLMCCLLQVFSHAFPAYDLPSSLLRSSGLFPISTSSSSSSYLMAAGGLIRLEPPWDGNASQLTRPSRGWVDFLFFLHPTLTERSKGWLLQGWVDILLPPSDFNGAVGGPVVTGLGRFPLFPPSDFNGAVGGPVVTGL
eukprot:530065-Prorocentrum_minimum.AAC.1